ncbi:hypothetical protein FQR65_LT10796 [Abscondita terminalis]|nr:hypothetical protein FQR65_LT10796 [Abscondita terminalis]
MCDNVDTIEQFYGVYLLYCLNLKYKGRTYIGYTVDPNRRIKQHNKGRKAGGAWKTSNRGPWSMVLIVHGFPNDISALRFEWAWQHPDRSRRLNHLIKKRRKEPAYDYTLRILSEMFQVGPWNRLPLTIRWLNHEYEREFIEKLPPLHMPVCYGPVVSKKLKNAESKSSIASTCTLCTETIIDKPMRCINSSCGLTAHLTCLSERFLEAGEYVPIEGKCPCCQDTYLWGDYVRKFKGCYGNLNVVIDEELAQFSMSDSE